VTSWRPPEAARAASLNLNRGATLCWAKDRGNTTFSVVPAPGRLLCRRPSSPARSGQRTPPPSRLRSPLRAGNEAPPSQLWPHGPTRFPWVTRRLWRRFPFGKRDDRMASRPPLRPPWPRPCARFPTGLPSLRFPANAPARRPPSRKPQSMARPAERTIPRARSPCVLRVGGELNDLITQSLNHRKGGGGLPRNGPAAGRGRDGRRRAAIPPRTAGGPGAGGLARALVRVRLRARPPRRLRRVQP